MNLASTLNLIQNWLTLYALKAIVAIAIFFIGKWLARKLTKALLIVLNKKGMDITVINFVEGILYYSLLGIVLIITASQLGIETTSFIAILGAAGLAVGLALKDSLSNFASGIMLVIFKPFRVGDVIKTNGIIGTVQKVSIFNTILHSPDNQKIIIPNSKITTDNITNLTANDTRRIDMTIGIGYEDNIKKAKEILTQIISAHPKILKFPEPIIAVSELADSSVNFAVRPWVKTEDYWNVYFELIEKIKTTFDAQGISIPYPQQDVHLFLKNSPTS
ncbi:small conductance mechanosensitive channel [Desulfonauticus submarinus]|uniref:Small conductance mechanosensitive channel n=1 Tax=Desulfonauticus submarinus TaxID=206665 RepID=A0A1H0ESR0_9BACT|nr:mechanosensitive ion channel domain-containing protein [Desulfonauticus submarinus]SDN85401.1 small conductance mechanosensitive channel [Desulfonauticus submarinus]